MNRLHSVIPGYASFDTTDRGLTDPELPRDISIANPVRYGDADCADLFNRKGSVSMPSRASDLSVSVCPRFTVYDLPRTANRQPMSRSNIAHMDSSLDGCAHLPDVIFGEFGITVPRSLIASPVEIAICMVAGLGIPSKIRKPIIVALAVPMARLHTRGPRAYKRFKHELMYQPRTTFTLSRQRSRKVSSGHRTSRQDSPWYRPNSTRAIARQATHPSQIRHFVHSIKSPNGAPLLNLVHTTSKPLVGISFAASLQVLSA